MRSSSTCCGSSSIGINCPFTTANFCAIASKKCPHSGQVSEAENTTEHFGQINFRVVRIFSLPSRVLYVRPGSRIPESDQYRSSSTYPW